MRSHISSYITLSTCWKVMRALVKCFETLRGSEDLFFQVALEKDVLNSSDYMILLMFGQPVKVSH